MTETDTTAAPPSVTSIWPAVVLLVVAIAAFVVARGYPPTSARFPSLAAGVMIVLAILDLLSRSGLPGAGFVEAIGGTGFRRREMMHNPSVPRQFEAIGWIAGAFVLMAALGILAASPIFCAGFVWLRGGRTLIVAAGVGLAVLAFQLAVFEWALDYTLYRGLLFTKGGISAW